MIDIGVNLTNNQYKNDRHQVVQNDLAANVSTMIVTGTSIEQSHQAVQLAREYPQCLYATAGIHPHDAASFNKDSIRQLSTLLADKKTIAVGECGLDFNRNYSTPREQLSCFEAQLELAVELQMPVFLHQRDAHKDFFLLIKKYRSGLNSGLNRAVAHCFTGGEKELQACLDQDLHIGITGWLCDDRRGKDLQAAVKLIPINRLMVETDAPYLFPRDYQFANEELLNSKQKKKLRRRNEPQYLPHIIKTLAQFIDRGEPELMRITTDNARCFFQI